MGKHQKRRVPKYPSTPHASGQAKIKIDGKDYYLGKFGSPESKKEFGRLLAEFFSTNARPVPKHEQGKQVTPAGPTVAELCRLHTQWARTRYIKNGEQTTEPADFVRSLRPVWKLFATNHTDDFRPEHLLAVRKLMVDAGMSVGVINQRIGRIKRVFQWGVSRSLVRYETFAALTTVEGLRKGEAKTHDKVLPVDLAKVEAIRPHTSPQVWTMVQLQLATGMRPGEACIMRTCDIFKNAKDASVPLAMGGCWLYIPDSHKTEHHGKQRLILLGPQAQALLEPWLRPDAPDQYLFRPRDAKQHFSQQRAAAAKQAGKNRKRVETPQRAAGERYRTGAYDHAVMKACEKAFGMPTHLRKIAKVLKDADGTPFPPAQNKARRRKLQEEAAAWRKEFGWSPNQLRHTAATEIRQRYGAELARVILGHSQLSTTEIYAERDYSTASKAIAEFG